MKKYVSSIFQELRKEYLVPPIVTEIRKTLPCWSQFHLAIKNSAIVLCSKPPQEKIFPPRWHAFSLSIFIWFVRTHCFNSSSFSVTKHNNQDNIQKKAFNLGLMVPRVRVHNHHGGERGARSVTESSHLTYNQAAERANWWWCGLLKPALRDSPPPTRPHLLIFPRQNHQLRNKHQLFKPERATLIQTTILSFLKYVKNLHILISIHYNSLKEKKVKNLAIFINSTHIIWLSRMTH